nr:protein sum2 [Quercus suber]
MLTTSRYIGTLHEINSENHTVALESVSSYGTEGRLGDPANEIPPSDNVYEYIVFRGSDVKELVIVAPPGAPKENRPPQMPNDPAILGQQQFGYGPPPGAPGQFHGHPRFQGPGGPHGFPGSPGAVPAYGNYPPPPPGYGYGPPGPGFPHGPPGQFHPHQQGPIGPPGHHMNQQGPPQSQPSTGSKQGTPQPPPGQPSVQQPPPVQQQDPAEMSATPVPPVVAKKSAPPPPNDTKPSPAVAAAPAVNPRPQQPTGQKPAPKANNRVAIPLPTPNSMAAKPAQRPSSTVNARNASASTVAPPSAPAPVSAVQPQQPQTVADATQAATAAVAAAMAKLAPGTSNNRQQAQASTENLTQQVSQLRINDGHRGGKGRGRGGARGGRRDPASQLIGMPKEDYDFEEANRKFNKQDLVKEAIASGSPLGSPVNGVATAPLSVSLQSKSNGSAEDVVIPPKPSTEKGYDKKSSFFDNISSDLKDRIEQQSNEQVVDGRAMRREERTKNFDTFGQGSVDTGYRGGYRGRGRGRGHGRGRGYNGSGSDALEPRNGGYRGRGRNNAESTAV